MTPQLLDSTVSSGSSSNDDERKNIVLQPNTLVRDQELSTEALRRHLSEQLPEYMVPAAYVVLETIPLTPNGKTDRKALPTPEAYAYAVQACAPPVGQIEQSVAQVWAELLKINQVGRNDNFFELGGHSLMAVRVVSQLKQTNIVITVADLYKYPTMLYTNFKI